MKKSLRHIAGLVALSSLAAATAIGFWPQEIQVSGDALAAGHELKLAMWWDGGFEEAPLTRDGRATVGRGAWRAPWSNGQRLLAVYDDSKIYWEGVVKPPVVGAVEVPLSEGRPRASFSN